jgi:hypothetical protein
MANMPVMMNNTAAKMCQPVNLLPVSIVGRSVAI